MAYLATQKFTITLNKAKNGTADEMTALKMQRKDSSGCVKIDLFDFLLMIYIKTLKVAILFWQKPEETMLTVTNAGEMATDLREFLVKLAPYKF